MPSHIKLKLDAQGVAATQTFLTENYSVVSLADIRGAGGVLPDEDNYIECRLLHIKKAEKQRAVLMTKSARQPGEKTYGKHYYRMLYVRTGTQLAAIIIKVGEHRTLMMLENLLQLGRAFRLIAPEFTHTWREIPLLTTAHPLIPASDCTSTTSEIAPGQLSSGPMQSFLVERERIAVLRVSIEETCMHAVCDGRYGKNCPGTTSSGLSVHAASLRFRIDDDGPICEPYVSCEMANAVFPKELLVYPHNPNADFRAMAQHLRKVLTEHKSFRMVGWYKPETREEDGLTSDFKLHISELKVVGEVLPPFVCE